MFSIIKFVCIMTGAICATIATKNPHYLWLLLLLIPSFCGDIIRLVLRNLPVYELKPAYETEEKESNEESK